MYNPKECTEIMEKSLGRSRDNFTQAEKKVLNNVIRDNLIGRYNSLICYTESQLNNFLNWVLKGGMDYFELSDGERWALEDVYTEKV